MKYLILFFFSITSFFLYSNIVYSADASLVSANKIEEKIKNVEEIKELDEQQKTYLLDLYNKTLAHLDAIENNEKEIKVFSQLRTQAPEEIKKLEKEVDKLEQNSQLEKLNPVAPKSSDEILTDISKIPLEELEQKLQSEQANLAAITARNSDLEQTLENERSSAPTITKRIVEANQLLEQRVEDKKLPPANKNSDLNQAEKWLIDTHIKMLRSELKMLDLKLLSQPSRLKLLKLKLERSNYQTRKIKDKLEELKQKVDLKRSFEIKKTEELTRNEQLEVLGKHPLVQTYAKQNSKLSETITQRTKELIELETNDDIVFRKTQKISDNHDNTRKKLEIAGLNQVLGQVIWEQKKKLPDSREYLKNLEKREKLVASLGLEHLQYQEELSNIKNSKDYLSDLLTNIKLEQHPDLQEDLSKLIKTRRELLEKIISVDEKYLKAISDLDFAEKKLVEVANAYSDFLDKHLFWLRSATMLNWTNVTNMPEQIRYILDPGLWFNFVQEFFSVSRSFYQSIPGLILIIFLILKRARLKELLIDVGHKTRKISTDKLLHTWQAIFYTILLALPIPALFWLGSWQVSNAPDISTFTSGVARGMKVIVMPLFSLSLFRYMCLPGGLFEVHFKWSDELINGLRKEMWRLIITFIPIIFITAILISRGESSINGGLGRLFLIFTLLTFAIFYYRMMKPKNGFLSAVAENNPTSFFARYQTLLFIAGLAALVALMVFTIIGYVYTAAGLTSRLIVTVWFVFALIILQQVSVRWLLLTRRRYALKTAYEKRLAAHAEKEEDNKEEPTEVGENEFLIEVEEPEIDMISLSKETQKLLNLAFFILTISVFIYFWADLLPALSILEQVTLWHYEGVVDGAKKLLPITLSDLVLAFFVLIVTLVGAKRFPAIIEILLLQYSSISSGDRYTITTLINYAIFGIGLFIIFKILGADWGRLQWLFAALGVGIGFGLQEIVANFISGLIILFERPIRVGDFVSVGENEGVVSRIQIRATTIVTYDRKELLVPNKEFITGQLVNLSLSDPTARLVIPVGVAYGTDIPKARELLFEALSNQERVLKEPPPRVIFHSFGDNTLNLELRCFIDNVDYRMRVISDINETINNKFNEAGITIAFPQRDVHLNIQHPIDIRVKGKDS
jgi:potassium efflux system protein